MRKKSRGAVVVRQVLDGLDAVQYTCQGPITALATTPDFYASRLYVGAVGYLHGLHSHAQLPAARGEPLLKCAQTARDALRGELAELLSDGWIDADHIPRRRGNSARSVGHELLELAREGHHTLLTIDELKTDVFGRLTRARLLGEQLLTMVGELDAPPLVRELSNEYRLAWALFVSHWRPLREELARLCTGPEELARLAPALP